MEMLKGPTCPTHDLERAGYLMGTQWCSSDKVGELDCAIPNFSGNVEECMSTYCDPVDSCAFVSVSTRNGDCECNPHTTSAGNYDALNQGGTWYTRRKAAKECQPLRKSGT